MAHIELISDRSVEAVDAESAGTEPPSDGGSTAFFDERFSIRLCGHTYYVNLRIGTEKRSPERRWAEGQVSVSGIAFLYCVICSAAIMLFGTLCLFYLIKSGLGINLSDGHSLLHPLFEMIERPG